MKLWVHMRLRKPLLGVVNPLNGLPAIHKSVITPAPKLILFFCTFVIIRFLCEKGGMDI